MFSENKHLFKKYVFSYNFCIKYTWLHLMRGLQVWQNQIPSGNWKTNFHSKLNNLQDKLNTFSLTNEPRPQLISI